MIKSIRCLSFLLTGLSVLSISCNKNDIDTSSPQLNVIPVDFSKLESSIAFGQDLSADQKSPAFEYILDNANEEVISCTDGYIDQILDNDGFSDVEIHIKPSLNSEWTIIYDHVKNISFSQGDFIEAGTSLGKVGDGNRTELQLNQGNGKHAIAHCPLDFSTTAFTNAHLNFKEEWCLTKTVTP